MKNSIYITPNNKVYGWSPQNEKKGLIKFDNR
jgi:hypothetical protein